MTKYNLSKYTAFSYHEVPDNELYSYAHDNGRREELWTFSNIEQALDALKDFETSCELKHGNEDYFEITCYALESEDV